MNWYKRELVKEAAFNWNDFLKGFGYAVAALAPVFMQANIQPQEAQQIIQKHNGNPQAIQQEIQSRPASTQPTTLPTSQPTNKPTTQQAPQFDYNDFRGALEKHEGRRPSLYDDGTGVQTVGVGHAVGKNPNDPRALRSRETFKKVFGPDSKWDSLWQQGTLEDKEIDQLADHDIDTHKSRAKKRFPQYDSYPYYVQKALLDGIYRGDIGPMTQSLINAGDWGAAANEYIDRRDYANAEKNNMRGIKTRMDSNRAAMLKYDSELRAKK